MSPVIAPIVTGPNDWRARGECVNKDPEIWFADRTAKARKICDGCPVREICLQDAIDERDFEGVRGGLSGRQRRRLAASMAPGKPGCTAANEARREQGRANSARIAELALAGDTAAEIAVKVEMAPHTVSRYLVTLRAAGTIPEGAGRAPRKPITHGTRGGYTAHQSRGEVACDECMVALREYETVRRAARKAAGL
jgi:WhiB family redox-sensing transcriptional regulator